MAQKDLWNLARENMLQDKEVHCQRKKETLSDSTRLCMKRIS